MSKKERQKLLAEIAEIKTFQSSINNKMDQYIEQLKIINTKLDQLTEKFDVILKWSKYSDQLWDRN
jgi:uncharacterized coiled-coil DUF342 family protein